MRKIITKTAEDVMAERKKRAAIRAEAYKCPACSSEETFLHDTVSMLPFSEPIPDELHFTCCKCRTAWTLTELTETERDALKGH